VENAQNSSIHSRVYSKGEERNARYKNIKKYLHHEHAQKIQYGKYNESITRSEKEYLGSVFENSNTTESIFTNIRGKIEVVPQQATNAEIGYDQKSIKPNKVHHNFDVIEKVSHSCLKLD